MVIETDVILLLSLLSYFRWCNVHTMISIRRKVHVPFVIKISRFFSFFGIVPWYNVDKQKLIHTKVFKIYSTSLVILLTSGTLVLLYIRYSFFGTDLDMLEAILVILLELISLSTLLVTLLGAAFWNMHVWEELHNRYTIITSPVELMFKIRNRDFIVRHSRMIFLIGNIYLLILLCIEFFVVEKGIEVAPYYIADFILTYFDFIVSFQIINIVGLIRCKYFHIRKLFKRYSKNNEYLITRFRNIGRLYADMDEIVEIFNRLFGWPLVFLLFDLLLGILSTLVQSTNSTFSWRGKVYDVGTEVVIVNALYLFQSAVSTSVAFFVRRTNIFLCSKSNQNQLGFVTVNVQPYVVD